ncbi:MAG: cytochrome c biogenesis protein CcsA [Bacteroidota bacterium]
MIKENWWKILGVILVLFGYIGGILTPLKPGLPNVYPFNGQVNTSLDLTIEGYNTHFDQVNQQRVWLKLGERNLAGKNIIAKSPNNLQVTFDIPKLLPTTDSVAAFTLITSNEIDGTSVLPSAVFIKQTTIDTLGAIAAWPRVSLDELSKYAGMAFPFRNILGETIRNLIYHVPLWFAMFIMLAIGVFFSIKHLRSGNILHDHRANSLIAISVVYGLLGCATGSIWAKYTWGTWWTADVKLNMTAVFMLIYLAYFVLRESFPDATKKARLSSVYNIFAFASLIPLLFVIPRLVDSLHPGNGGNPGFGGEDLDNTMRIVFYPMIIGMTLVGIWISDLRYRLAVIQDKILDKD